MNQINPNFRCIYVFKHIELDDDLKPYLELKTPPKKQKEIKLMEEN